MTWRLIAVSKCNELGGNLEGTANQLGLRDVTLFTLCLALVRIILLRREDEAMLRSILGCKTHSGTTHAHHALHWLREAGCEPALLFFACVQIRTTGFAVQEAKGCWQRQQNRLPCPAMVFGITPSNQESLSKMLGIATGILGMWSVCSTTMDFPLYLYLKRLSGGMAVLKTLPKTMES